MWRRPEDHPLLKHTDTAHPALRAKLAETFPPKIAEGLPKILSENSEDARTWYYFSPLVNDEPQRTRVLTLLLRQAFADALPPHAYKAIPSAKLEFWPKIPPPSTRPKTEGESEPDLLIRLGESALVLVEAKCQSGVSEFSDLRPQTRPGDSPDRRRLMVCPPGGLRLQLRARTAVRRCPDQRHEDRQPLRPQPEAIQKALPYRDDLSEDDFDQLARGLAFVRWPDPLF